MLQKDCTCGSFRALQNKALYQHLLWLYYFECVFILVLIHHCNIIRCSNCILLVVASPIVRGGRKVGAYNEHSSINFCKRQKGAEFFFLTKTNRGWYREVRCMMHPFWSMLWQHTWQCSARVDESEVGVCHRAWACMGAGDDSLERGTGDPTHSLPPLSPLERVWVVTTFDNWRFSSQPSPVSEGSAGNSFLVLYL